jgi:hypothetical protein
MTLQRGYVFIEMKPPVIPSEAWESLTYWQKYHKLTIVHRFQNLYKVLE